jgi:hypothetical protein
MSERQPTFRRLQLDSIVQRQRAPHRGEDEQLIPSTG